MLGPPPPPQTNPLQGPLSTLVTGAWRPGMEKGLECLSPTDPPQPRTRILFPPSQPTKLLTSPTLDQPTTTGGAPPPPPTKVTIVR